MQLERWAHARASILRLTIALVACVLLAGCPRRQPPPPPPPPPPPVALPAPDDFRLPEFPWPPPRPSAELTLLRTLFPSAKQFEVGEQLTSALVQAGYSEYSFYSAPGGFALVSRLERVREDGTAAPQELRFLQPGAEEPFSLTAYISRLFFAPTGYYRLIVFVVTDQPFTTDASKTIVAEEATRLLRSGANRLPDAYRSRDFSPSHAITALIYEFRKDPGDRDVRTLDPGRFDGREHLQRAGILSALEHPGGK
jgi:hypothetical protein